MIIWGSFYFLRRFRLRIKDINRIAAIVLAVVLGLFAVALLLSLLEAALGNAPFLGLFFFHVYHVCGLFWFLSPAYLGYVALRLINSHCRSSRIFILITAPVPFFTLALDFICIRNFDALSRDYAFLAMIGKTGLSLIVVVAALLEVMAIQMLQRGLFLEASVDREKPDERENRQQRLPGPEAFDTDGTEVLRQLKSSEMWIKAQLKKKASR